MEKAYIVPESWFQSRYDMALNLSGSIRAIRHLLEELQHGSAQDRCKGNIEEITAGLVSLLDLWEKGASEELGEFDPCALKKFVVAPAHTIKFGSQVVGNIEPTVYRLETALKEMVDEGIVFAREKKDVVSSTARAIEDVLGPVFLRFERGMFTNG